MLLFIFLLVLTLFQLSIAAPQRCNEVISYAEATVANYNISMSLVFDVTITSNYSNLITLKNVTTTFLSTDLYTIDDNSGVLNVCLRTFVGYTNMPCYDLNETVTALLYNETFEFYISWLNKNISKNSQNFYMFSGFVDGGNLIFYNGSMYTAKDECMLYNKWDRYNLNGNSRGVDLTSHTSCCNSMIPVIEAPTNLPKCKNFHADTSVIEVSNNKTFMTLLADFVLSDYDIKAIGKTADSDLVYAINSFVCQIQDTNNYQFCEFSFNEKDNEMRIELGPYGGIEWNPYTSYPVGRIILRQNQTLMEEGIPFTAENRCFNSTIPFSEVYFVHQFCCTQFEDFIPSSPPITTQQPLLATFQQCDKVTTTSSISSYSLNVTITADLEISSYENDKNNIELKNLTASIPLSFEDSNAVVCYQVIGERNENPGTCVSNNTKLTISDQIVNIYSPYNRSDSETNTVSFYYGLINEGSFVSYDGQRFSETNKCRQVNQYLTTCCTSFKPFQTTLFNFPRCTNFKLTSNIYYYSTNEFYTNVEADLVLTDTDIFATATGPGVYFNDAIYTPLYFINGIEFQNSVNNIQFGGYHLANYDSEILIHLGSTTPSYYYPHAAVLSGRIVLLNGQTYMDSKGTMPFYENSCQKISQKYDSDDLYSVSELCCSDIPQASTTPGPTTTDSTTTLSISESSTATPATSASTSTLMPTSSTTTIPQSSSSTTTISTTTTSKGIASFLNVYLLTFAVLMSILYFT